MEKSGKDGLTKPLDDPPRLPGHSGKEMTQLVLKLIRPYYAWLVVIFSAMLLETAMSIAAPWPLKIIIDNVIGKHKLPEFMGWLRDFSFGENTMALAGVAAAITVLIAVIAAVAGYIDALPSKLRFHFKNDTAQLLDYIHNPATTKADLAALGLVDNFDNITPSTDSSKPEQLPT